jgi:phosphate/sulfate permease
MGHYFIHSSNYSTYIALSIAHLQLSFSTMLGFTGAYLHDIVGATVGATVHVVACFTAEVLKHPAIQNVTAEVLKHPAIQDAFSSSIIASDQKKLQQEKLDQKKLHQEKLDKDAQLPTDNLPQTLDGHVENADHANAVSEKCVIVKKGTSPPPCRFITVDKKGTIPAPCRFITIETFQTPMMSPKSPMFNTPMTTPDNSPTSMSETHNDETAADLTTSNINKDVDQTPFNDDDMAKFYPKSKIRFWTGQIMHNCTKKFTDGCPRIKGRFSKRDAIEED